MFSVSDPGHAANPFRRRLYQEALAAAKPLSVPVRRAARVAQTLPLRLQRHPARLCHRVPLFQPNLAEGAASAPRALVSHAEQKAAPQSSKAKPALAGESERPAIATTPGSSSASDTRPSPGYTACAPAPHTSSDPMTCPKSHADPGSFTAPQRAHRHNPDAANGANSRSRYTRQAYAQLPSTLLDPVEVDQLPYGI